MSTRNLPLNNHFARPVAATAFILLIPLVAMQFTNEVNWTALDFAVAGILLLTVGFVYEFLVSKIRSRQRRLIAIALLAIAFLYMWAELAVGIFTNLGS